MGEEAQRLKNFYGVNGTAFLIDSSIAFDDDNSEPANGPYVRPRLTSTEEARLFYKLEKDLVMIIAHMMSSERDHNPMYFVQYDQREAW